MIIRRKYGVASIQFLKDGGTYLHVIEVHPEYRGQGYGNKLMDLVIKKSKYPIYLLASAELGGDPDMLAKWYKRYGFVRKRGSSIGYNYNMVKWE